jgi:hypothetical protein
MVQYSNNTDDKESSTGLGINVITNFVWIILPCLNNYVTNK